MKKSRSGPRPLRITYNTSPEVYHLLLQEQKRRKAVGSANTSFNDILNDSVIYNARIMMWAWQVYGYPKEIYGPAPRWATIEEIKQYKINGKFPLDYMEEQWRGPKSKEDDSASESQDD